MSPCPSTCADLAAPSECDTTSCVEGCQCAAGFVMSEGMCVPYAQCGCTFLNRYYPVRGLMEELQYWLCFIVWWCDLISSSLSPLSLHPAAEREVCDWRLFSGLWMHQHRRSVPNQNLSGWLCLHHLRIQTWLPQRCVCVFIGRALQYENSFIIYLVSFQCKFHWLSPYLATIWAL